MKTSERRDRAAKGLPCSRPCTLFAHPPHNSGRDRTKPSRPESSRRDPLPLFYVPRGPLAAMHSPADNSTHSRHTATRILIRSPSDKSDPRHTSPSTPPPPIPTHFQIDPQGTAHKNIASDPKTCHPIQIRVVPYTRSPIQLRVDPNTCLSSMEECRHRGRGGSSIWRRRGRPRPAARTRTAGPRHRSRSADRLRVLPLLRHRLGYISLWLGVVITLCLVIPLIFVYVRL